MRQIPLAIAPPPESSFDSYLAGANHAALEHLRQLAPHSAPVYLWGPTGSGKTHLLRALALAWQARGERVAWFASGVGLPWTFDERAALVVLDDCDAYDAARQQAAFALFVQATAAAIAIVSAGALPPVDLSLREDLRTRLGWGLVFALQPLAESQVRAVLRREADRRGIRLADEVLDHLLTRFARDLTRLMALLDRLDEFALASQRAVTVPLLKKMFEEEGP
ncbi:MAG TPA: DnaA regulatory inactivator Hda [Burkholderiaceae bacterium]|jgi:DnaA family protein|nr:DnaA regulatory inactivator Hda [Burkholderiaceae bacterium]